MERARSVASGGGGSTRNENAAGRVRLASIPGAPLFAIAPSRRLYAGGGSSVRGYETSSIGPKDALGDALGGKTLAVANAELYFPFPGLEKDKSVRLSLFVDAGAVSDNFDFGETRYSAGVALSWFSPVGPIKISIGKALNSQPDDRTQPFQFSLGTVF